ncbi:YdeI/OmpD-associated family protein [Fulvivirga lutea]|uniref:YdeI/OmpD-associated family protein n=1 Tax=Fulvivirga lutea TaxID=2810512 RepID=A0A975A039_9BACT|nr:YdeI/OmpD-associated family protein [Fulvivirga lutea]QSE96057.1 YdeI/OmpD-associated family protein [Fulvivirga lutea]
MTPTFFATPQEFRNWLAENHDKETELIVGYYKVATGKPSITWPESVDQALCFGWIDGIRRSIDEESYCVRFTPRRTDSIWSAVNIKKVEELKEAGLMEEAGLKAYSLKTKSKIYSYENRPEALAKNYEKIFKENKNAWKFHNNQPPFYKKQCVHWVMSAKQEKTRLSRLDKLIKASENQQRVKW